MIFDTELAIGRRRTLLVGVVVITCEFDASDAVVYGIDCRTVHWSTRHDTSAADEVDLCTSAAGYYRPDNVAHDRHEPALRYTPSPVN